MSALPTYPHIAANQTWLRRKEHDAVRVMGVVEGWVVFRRKGCAPMLETIRVFARDFTRCT